MRTRRFPSNYSASSENYSEIPDSILQQCIEGDTCSLRDMLNKGSDVEERDRRGRTGLHWAAIRGRDEVMSMLLSWHADPVSSDNLGNTPLHYCGHAETINCLIESGADPYARNYRGQTPLTLMSRRGVDQSALNILEDMEEEDDVLSMEDSAYPLMRHRQRKTAGPGWKLRTVRSLWYEFCMDLGAERLVLVLLVILCVSLYLAYAVTGLAKHRDTRIPVHTGEL